MVVFGLAAAAAWLTGVAGAGPAAPPLVPPPLDAAVLFNGRDLSGWVQRGSIAPARWKVADGVMEVVPRTGDIHTKQNFTDFQPGDVIEAYELETIRPSLT